MLHTNFQGHRSFGSIEEDCLTFIYMGMSAILVIRPAPYEQTFFSNPMEAAHKNWLQSA